MYGTGFIFRMIIIFLIFAVAACYIDIDFPDRCTFRSIGSYREAYDRRDRKEKSMIVILSLLTSIILTALTTFIFNFMSNNPPDLIMNISSLTVGIGGGIYYSIPLLENVAYGDRFRMNPVAQRLLRKKKKCPIQNDRFIPTNMGFWSPVVILSPNIVKIFRCQVSMLL